MSENILEIPCINNAGIDEAKERQPLTVTTYYGGTKFGKKLQLSHGNGYVQLNRNEIVTLVTALIDAFNIDIPIKRVLKFHSIDYWNRVIFKDRNKNYYADLNNLFGGNATIAEMSSVITESTVEYYGKDLEGDPLGGTIDPKLIKLLWK